MRLGIGRHTGVPSWLVVGSCAALLMASFALLVVQYVRQRSEREAREAWTVARSLVGKSEVAVKTRLGPPVSVVSRTEAAAGLKPYPLPNYAAPGFAPTERVLIYIRGAFAHYYDLDQKRTVVRVFVGGT